MSLAKHPFWGLLTYIFLYYNCPSPLYNWWASDLPDFRWSLLAAIVVIASMAIHFNKTNKVNPFSLANYRYLFWLLLLMLLVSFNAFSSSASYSSLYDFFRYLICFVFFINCINNIDDFDKLVWFCLLCTFVLAVEAYLHPEYRNAGRLERISTPDSTDANLIATVFVITIPYLFMEVLFASKFRKGLALIFSVFICNAIILTGSRGALVGLAAIGIYILFAVEDWKVKKKIFLGGVLGIGLFIYLLDPTFLNRLLEFQSGADQSGSGRLEIWPFGLDMARDYPFGAGGRGFQLLSTVYIPENLLTEGIRSPHNTYLMLFVEQSVLGLLLFLLSWKQSLAMLKVISTKVEDYDGYSRTYRYSIATRASIVGVLVCGFFVDRLYFELLYWLAGMSGFLYYYHMTQSFRDN
jgi:O-antigen ligase